MTINNQSKTTDGVASFCEALNRTNKKYSGTKEKLRSDERLTSTERFANILDEVNTKK